ncbi:MAG: hypothetical protein WC607_01590 [Candidatus Micrarchaeia archaeon]
MRNVLFVLVALTALNAAAAQFQLAIPNLDTITQAGTCPAAADFEQRFYIAEGFIIAYNYNIHELIDAGETQFEDSLLSTERAAFQALTLDDIEALREPLLALNVDPDASDLIKTYCMRALIGLGPVITQVSLGSAPSGEDCVYTVNGSYDLGFYCVNCYPPHDDYDFDFTALNGELVYPEGVTTEKTFTDDEIDVHTNYAAFSFGDGVPGFFDVTHEEVGHVYVPATYRNLIEVKPVKNGDELTVSFVKIVEGVTYEALVPVYYKLYDSDKTKGPFFATSISGITVDDVTGRDFEEDDVYWIFNGATPGGYSFRSAQTLEFRQFLTQCERGSLIEKFEVNPSEYFNTNLQVGVTYDLAREANVEVELNRFTLDPNAFPYLGLTEQDFTSQLLEPVYAFATVQFDKSQLTLFNDAFYYELGAPSSETSVYWDLESSTFNGNAGTPPGIYEFTLFATDGQCFEEKRVFLDLQEIRTADARTTLYQYVLFKGEGVEPVGAEVSGVTLQDVSSENFGLDSYEWALAAYTDKKNWNTQFTVTLDDSVELQVAGTRPVFEGAFEGFIYAQLVLSGLPVSRDSYAVLTVNKGEAGETPGVEPGAGEPGVEPTVEAVEPIEADACITVMVCDYPLPDFGISQLGETQRCTVQSEAYLAGNPSGSQDMVLKNNDEELFSGSLTAYSGRVRFPDQDITTRNVGDETFTVNGVECETVFLEESKLAPFDLDYHSPSLQTDGWVYCHDCQTYYVEVVRFLEGGSIEPVSASSNRELPLQITGTNEGVQYASGFSGIDWGVQLYHPLSVLTDSEYYGGDLEAYESIVQDLVFTRFRLRVTDAIPRSVMTAPAPSTGSDETDALAWLLSSFGDVNSGIASVVINIPEDVASGQFWANSLRQIGQEHVSNAVRLQGIAQKYAHYSSADVTAAEELVELRNALLREAIETGDASVVARETNGLVYASEQLGVSEARQSGGEAFSDICLGLAQNAQRNAQNYEERAAGIEQRIANRRVVNFVKTATTNAWEFVNEGWETTFTNDDETFGGTESTALYSEYAELTNEIVDLEAQHSQLEGARVNLLWVRTQDLDVQALHLNSQANGFLKEQISQVEAKRQFITQQLLLLAEVEAQTDYSQLEALYSEHKVLTAQLDVLESEQASYEADIQALIDAGANAPVPSWDHAALNAKYDDLDRVQAEIEQKNAQLGEVAQDAFNFVLHQPVSVDREPDAAYSAEADLLIETNQAVLDSLRQAYLTSEYNPYLVRASGSSTLCSQVRDASSQGNLKVYLTKPRATDALDGARLGVEKFFGGTGDFYASKGYDFSCFDEKSIYPVEANAEPLKGLLD